MIYENEQDRQAQTEVVGVVYDFLKTIPIVGENLVGGSHFTITETPEIQRDSHDFNVNHDGKYVAAGEVKCRTGRYTLEYMEENGWMIAKERLTKLRIEHHNHGKHVMLVLRTSDGYVLYVMLTVLIRHGKMLKNAPEGACKTNHGKEPKNETGLIIPYSLLKRIGRCGT